MISPNIKVLTLAFLSTKVVLVGDSGVGKTTLINKYIKNDRPQSKLSTIGVEFSTKFYKMVNKEDVKVQFWDTAGQDRYRTITQTHLKNTDAAIVVFDLTNYTSFQNIKQWIEELHYQGKPHLLILLLGNKLDVVLKSNMARQKLLIESLKRQVKRQEAESFANSYATKIDYAEISALQISNEFNSSMNKFVQKLELYYRVNGTDETKLEGHERGCCTACCKEGCNIF